MQAHPTTSPPPPRAAPALEPLRALSASLLQLAALARTAPPEGLLLQALQMLRGTLVDFDTAWWGEVSAGDAGAPPRNWLHGSIGLAKGFAAEWNALAMADLFAQQSMDQLGVVLRESADDMPPQGVEQGVEIPPDIDAFCRRHGLYHCMAITVAMPKSGLMFFVSMYRGPGRPNFTDTEAALFGEFVPHLLAHWQHRLEQLQTAPAGNGPWDSYALADGAGQLLFVGLRVGRALQAAYPDWSGTALPAALLGALPATLPGSLALGRACRLRLEACGPLLAISMPSPHDSKPPLAPRELSAATLYAHGQSYKDIATTLGLTPATVRTYLRSAYAQLGVRNKVELVAALRR
ncbi:DNA-binding CsgD family transcriptional regulator [Acidovorax soli]|uniref:DNA-binding CsgD family transcriptional regulator n=1 Tax=Acidovorax soli TaxID=592050 RepID=A0A7X0PBY6_9BURK|nr:helix-turn-helix transcriptional regulator [Acidovorax soli]MBB6559098.1 DNA-binding CsgD family transcriptional regulator [Acidovorax soli]